MAIFNSYVDITRGYPKHSNHFLPEKGMLSPASEPSQGGPRIFRGTLGEETLNAPSQREMGDTGMTLSLGSTLINYRYNTYKP